MKICAVGHIKVFRITLKSGAGKSALPRVDIDRVRAQFLAASLRYTQIAMFRRRECVALRKTLYISIADAMAFRARAIKPLIYFGVLVTFTTKPAMADDQPRPFSFEVAKSDSAKAEKLADELVSL